MVNSQPNILFIISDEHDPAVMGCSGDTIVDTPNLDKLAKEGIRFENCYCNSPLCVPSRLSLTAGKYVSRKGVEAWNNQSTMENEIPSLPRILNDAGYETYLCGKMHYARDKRYGYTHDLIPKHNFNKKYMVSNRLSPDNTHINYNNWKNRSNKFGVSDTSSIIKKDTVRTVKAVDFLKSRKKEDPPFFFTLGYIAPHFPLLVPEKLYEKYKDKVPMPEIPEGFLETLPKNYKQHRLGFGYEHAEPEKIKLGRECYWALIDWLDQQLGKVLRALEESEVANNTIIIFTSDHGENKGDHGLWWKNVLYDHSTKIPLIIKWPNTIQPNQTRSGVCSMVDIVQMMGDIAGADIPSDWNGDSLLPYICDQNYAWKDMAFSEYHAHFMVSGISMLRKGKYKYVYHASKEGKKFPAEKELYDLENDPKEFINHANNSKYNDILAQMHTDLVEEIGREPEKTERYYEAIFKALSNKNDKGIKKLFRKLLRKK